MEKEGRVALLGWMDIQVLFAYLQGVAIKYPNWIYYKVERSLGNTAANVLLKIGEPVYGVLAKNRHEHVLERRCVVESAAATSQTTTLTWSAHSRRAT